MKLATALLLCLISSGALGQTAVQQNGPVSQFDIPRWNQDHRVESAGGILGKNGRGVNPFTATDNKNLAFCARSGLSTAAHNALCFGHDANGNGLLSLDAMNGDSNKTMYLRKNGTSYEFPFTGTGGGNMVGPSTTAVNNAITWNNVTGSLVKDVGTTPVIKAGTNTLMKTLTLNLTNGAIIRRVGYDAEGDGPPLDFKWASGTCTSRGLANDGASCVDANDGNSLSGIFPGFVDVHWFGAHDDAVPGAVGAACSGITGTNNSPAFTSAYAYALTNRIDLIAGGTGIYRLNSKWLLNGFATPQPWNSNTQNPVHVRVSQPMVTCGTDAGVQIQTAEAYGMEIHLARLIGPGAAVSAPTPFGGAENIGVYVSGTSQENIHLGMVSDYTYNMLLENSFSNRLTIGLLMAAYKNLYLRDGACGVNCSTQDNIISFQKIGGVYTYNGDPEFTLRQGRSANWGVHIGGTGPGGNVLTGGTIEYNLKGTAGINLQVDTDHNYITAWVEGNSGVNGQNLVIGGSYNSLWLSDLASPSTGMTTNVYVSGTGNKMFGPVIGDPVVNTYGAVNINGNNFVNNNPVGVNAGALTFTCDTGTPTTISGTARYKKIGSLIFYEPTFTVTTLGTCAGGISITNLPAAPSPTRRNELTCWNNGGFAFVGLAMPGTTSLSMYKMDGTIPAVNGQTLQCSGWYNAE